MNVGVIKETAPDERRVALVPAEVGRLAKKGLAVVIETGAGQAAGYGDAAYQEKGARIVATRAAVFEEAQIIAVVRGPGAAGGADVGAWRGCKAGTLVAGFLDPLGAPEKARELAATGVTALALELVPRITRAQAIDALSSQANLAGYKSVLLAANELPKLFPMMMTAAGTISPARVFVVGAGVAGLQAISTAKRLGAVVEAYDVRPEVKDQVQSVGGRFIELALEADTAAATDAIAAGGYAKQQSEAFYQRQQALMAEHVHAADVVITTASVPGRRAPVLITEAMLEGCRPGTVLVDLAAETGGNCALTRPGETIIAHGVRIIGPVNLPSTVPFHASQLYARNITALIDLLVSKQGTLQLNLDDEIIAGSLVCRDGRVVHPRVLEALGASSGGNR